jgi:hypothetical protein
MARYFSYLFFFISATCYAQLKVNFVLLDSETNQPIKNALVYTSSSSFISGQDGWARLDIQEGEALYISHLAYRDTSISFHTKNFPDTLRLKRFINVLSEVEINSKPYLVFKSDECHVFDYEFLGDSLLVLTYEREKMFRKSNEQSESLFTGCKLLLVSPSGSILSEKSLIDEIRGFYRTPLDEIYVLSREAVFRIDTQMGIKLTPIKKDDFENHIKPIREKVMDEYVLDNFRWHYPEFSYFRYEVQTDSIQHIRTIRDDFTMELLRSEYKYMNNRDKLWAYRKELETGIDKEIISAYKTGFQSSLYYEELYAPIFKSDSSLLIFDHHSGYIFNHSYKGHVLDSVELKYTDQPRLKFDNLVLKDRGKCSYFSVFKKGVSRHLGRINLTTGNVEYFTRLYYPFPENIKLKNGSVYYLYRKPESQNFTYLFAESVE